MFRAILAIFTLILCGLTAPSTVLAKDSTTKSTQTEDVKFDQQAIIDEYKAMVKQSYAMPDDYDFVRLRELYRQLPNYNPYIDARRNFEKLNLEDDPHRIEKKLEEYIKKHFALSTAHLLLDSYYKKTKPEKENNHWSMGRGLTLAMSSSGFGEEPKTAYEVITKSEEDSFTYLYMDRETVERRIVKRNGRVYSVAKGKMKNINYTTDQDIEKWFHITHFLGRKQFQEELEKAKQD